jgi:hypothetical protein
MAKAFNSLSSRNNSFKPLGTHAIAVLARLAARNAVKEKIRADGERLSLMPPRIISERAKAHLEAHPELYQQALERALRLGWIEQDPRAMEK